MWLFNHCGFIDYCNTGRKSLCPFEMNPKSFYHLNVTQMAIMTAISWCYHMLFPPVPFLLESQNGKKNGCSVVNHRKWQQNQESDWVNSYSFFCHLPPSKWDALCFQFVLVLLLCSFNGPFFVVVIFVAQLWFSLNEPPLPI